MSVAKCAKGRYYDACTEVGIGRISRNDLLLVAEYEHVATTFVFYFDFRSKRSPLEDHHAGYCTPRLVRLVTMLHTPAINEGVSR